MTAEQKKWSPVALDAALVREARRLLSQQPEGLATVPLARRIFKMAALPEVVAEKMLRALLESDGSFSEKNGRWYLKTKPFSWKRPLVSTPFVVLDLEIIGRGQNTKIVELAAVKILENQLTETFYTLVNPGRPLSPGWFKEPRFSQADLDQAPKIGPVLEDFLRFAEASIWVAHNARFDLRALNLELRRTTYFRIANPVVDTLPLVRHYFPNLDAHNLPQLAAYFGIELEDHHHARSDAQALAEIFLKILHFIENEGFNSLEVFKPFSLPNPWEEIGKE